MTHLPLRYFAHGTEIWVELPNGERKFIANTGSEASAQIRAGFLNECTDHLKRLEEACRGC